MAALFDPDERAPVVDLDALTALIEMFGDDMNAVIDLLDTFLAESQKQVDSICTSFGVRDIGTLYRMAHSLKASSVIFGAKRLSAACARLEQAAADGCGDGRCAELLPIVIDEQQQATNRLTAVREQWLYT